MRRAARPGWSGERRSARKRPPRRARPPEAQRQSSSVLPPKTSRQSPPRSPATSSPQATNRAAASASSSTARRRRVCRPRSTARGPRSRRGCGRSIAWAGDRARAVAAEIGHPGGKVLEVVGGSRARDARGSPSSPRPIPSDASSNTWGCPLDRRPFAPLPPPSSGSTEDRSGEERGTRPQLLLASARRRSAVPATRTRIADSASRGAAARSCSSCSRKQLNTSTWMVNHARRAACASDPATDDAEARNRRLEALPKAKR